MRKIGIIGCGNMGQAVLKGILASGTASKRNILVSDIDSTKLNCIKRMCGIEATFNNSKVAKSSDVIIIAVKPQDVAKVLNGISEYLDKKKLLISIAAGVTTKKIKKLAGANVKIARVMPNMPALIGKGISAVFAKGLSSNQKKLVHNIFSGIGDVVEIKEKDFDTVTAISGSGPAYFFYLVEVMIDSAVSMGLKRDMAEKLAIKTALGSIQLLSQAKECAHSLRKRVTSKGGTTEAAFKLFKKKKLEKILKDGMKKAKQRSKQLQGG